MTKGHFPAFPRDSLSTMEHSGLSKLELASLEIYKEMMPATASEETMRMLAEDSIKAAKILLTELEKY